MLRNVITSPSPFPHPNPSPTDAAESKHQAQLAMYKRDPSKSAAADRLLQLSSTWSAGRRLSSVEEANEHSEHSASPTRYLRRPHPIVWVRRILSRTARRRAACAFVSAVIIYALFLRPLLFLDHTIEDQNQVQANSNSADPGAASAGRHRSSGTVAPLHERRHNNITNTRAPLPAVVLRHTTGDHPIVNGLLVVDPSSKVHPIYQLIRDAREEWDAKVARQSKTLKEAVAEYKRRHHRAPPKGFDKWWAYVVENNVQMPDEYDQIERDLLPFRALHPRDIKSRIEEATEFPDTYTLKIKHGSLRTWGTYDGEAISGANERLDGQVQLIKDVAHLLPDLTVVYSVHDTPSAVLSWDHRSELLEHVEEEEYIDGDDEIDLTLRGWPAACPHNSPMRREGAPEIRSPSSPVNEKTFIASHTANMDVCAHPELVSLHGVLAGKNPHVQELTPIFSLSKTYLHSDVLGIPTEQWLDNLPDIPWEEKHDERVLWRGSNTGAYYSAATSWRSSHRTRLIRLADSEDGQITILSPPKSMRGKSIGALATEIPYQEANNHYMDMAFTGEPIQCDWEDGTCDDLWAEYPFVEQMTHDAAFHFKYVVDVDGNAWSARFQRLLTVGSLVFKSTIMPEWWNDRIQPWVHYVPIQVDYSDLYDAVAFFRGDVNSRGGETPLAKDIAAAGRQWSLTHWRQQDMTAYVFRLYLEWARLLADSRKAMDFLYDESMEMSRE